MMCGAFSAVLFCPGQSPDLNPIKNIGLKLNANELGNIFQLFMNCLKPSV